jgi:hypothetical protein
MSESQLIKDFHIPVFFKHYVFSSNLYIGTCCSTYGNVVIPQEQYVNREI